MSFRGRSRQEPTWPTLYGIVFEKEETGCCPADIKHLSVTICNAAKGHGQRKPIRWKLHTPRSPSFNIPYFKLCSPIHGMLPQEDSSNASSRIRTMRFLSISNQLPRSRSRLSAPCIQIQCVFVEFRNSLE